VRHPTADCKSCPEQSWRKIPPGRISFTDPNASDEARRRSAALPTGRSLELRVGASVLGEAAGADNGPLRELIDNRRTPTPPIAGRRVGGGGLPLRVGVCPEVFRLRWGWAATKTVWESKPRRLALTLTRQLPVVYAADFTQSSQRPAPPHYPRMCRPVLRGGEEG
jgi:hypothetical protein